MNFNTISKIMSIDDRSKKYAIISIEIDGIEEAVNNNIHMIWTAGDNLPWGVVDAPIWKGEKTSISVMSKNNEFVKKWTNYFEESKIAYCFGDYQMINAKKWHLSLNALLMDVAMMTMWSTTSMIKAQVTTFTDGKLLKKEFAGSLEELVEFM